MKTKILLLSLALCACIFSAQMPKWTVGNSLIDFSGTSPTIINSLGINTGDLWSVNGFYDENNNLLFNRTGGGINQNTSFAQEMGIIRVPGSCNRFYLIGIPPAPVGGTTSLYYSMIEVSNGSVNYVPGYYMVNLGSMNTLMGSIAISKLKADNTRFLFATAGESRRFRISNTGITYEATIISNINDISDEADLYEDPVSGNMKLALATYAGFKVYNLNNQGGYISTWSVPSSFGVQNVRGLEFIDSNRLLVSQNNNVALKRGLAVINMASGSISYIPGSQQYLDSHIEKAIDGKFYTTSGEFPPYKLASVDIVNLTATEVVTLPAIGRYHVRALPEQVDNENYFTVNHKQDLASYDSPVDTGLEPNPSANTWINIYQSPDIWNRVTNSGLNLIHENPGYSGPGSNVMRFRVHNQSCHTSSPSYARLYWTMGSTGETWPDSWIGVGVGNIGGIAAGGELNIPYTGFNPSNIYVPGYGFKIPALAPGEEYIIDAKWHPVNPSIYGANADNVICFLGRIDDPNDPMHNEQVGPIEPNVVNNNNIVTRNTRLVNLSGVYPFSGSGFFIGNYFNDEHHFDIRFERVKDSGIPFENAGNVTIKLDPRIWQRWIEGGKQGEGIQILNYDQHEILVTNISKAILKNIRLQAKESLPVTVNFNLVNMNINTLEKYDFAVSQVASDKPSEQYGSVCHFLVDINREDQNEEYLEKQSGNSYSLFSDDLKLSPNPVSDIAFLSFTLKNDAKITAKITDWHGKEIKSLISSELKKGKNSIQFSTAGLPQGSYMVNISSGLENKSLQLMVRH